MEKTDMIRMATFLYSEKEGIRKKTTVLKRIVEAVFLEFDNSIMDITEIHNNILDVMEMFVAEDEIFQIIEKNQKYFVKVSEDRIIKYALQPSRYARLKENEKKNIGDYIEEFVEMNEYQNSAKDIIYRYIYYIFRKNIEDFSTIIGGKMEGDSGLDSDFEVEEQKIIKSFLEWNDNDKNEAILALMGCSLEYSMLTSDASKLYGTRLGNIFSNKILYIDTNIIYYCLGINGEEYKKANDLLLDKCLKAKEKLRITKITELEFTNTLNHYINEIKRYESESLSRINYKKYICKEDIYLFYLEWKNGRKHYNEPEYFKKFLESEYREWIKKYKIEVDKNVPYDEDDQKNAVIINAYTEEIMYKGTINYDAINIFWIESLRKNDDVMTGFAEEKYFILSPHRALKKWDMKRKLGLPVIVTPELWSLLLCRFISRSEDDFKSYINYINIKVPEEDIVINNKQFYIVIKAIEEVTEEINQQESIIDVLVEEQFAYLQMDELSEALSNEEINEEIYNKTKDKAESFLADKVASMEQELGKVNAQVVELQEQARKNLSGEEEKIKEVVIKEQEKVADVYAREKLRNRTILYMTGAVVLTGVLIWQIVDFFILKNASALCWNIVSELVKDTELSGNVTDVFIGICSLICTSIVFVVDKKALEILLNDDVKQKYLDKKKGKFIRKTEK